MNHSQISSIQHSLYLTLSGHRLTKLAEQVGFLARHRTILPFPLLVSLLTALGRDGNAETLADIHRKYNEMTSLDVSYHAWREQVTKPEFLILNVQLFLWSLGKQVKRTLSLDHESPFARFQHIWLHDGSSQAVVAKLKDVLPGRFKTVSPAAVEMHATMDLLTDNLVRVAFTEDTRSERACLPPLEHDLSHTLMLIDAGYFELEYFAAVNDREGAFLCRAPQDINPVVRKVNHENGKALHRYEGKKLKDVLSHFPRDASMDLDVEWPTLRGYIFRLVVRWNGQRKKWIFVVTNLDRHEFALADVFQAYRLRWQIELAFKEIKSYASWHRFNTACETLVASLILGSFVVAILKRSLAHGAERGIGVEISTRKVAMSGTHLFGNVMQALIVGNRTGVFQALERLLEFWQKNGRREHPARDRRSGRSALGLFAIWCS